MAPKKTRKVSSSKSASGTMTIPQLRRAFELLEKKTKEILEAPKDSRVTRFQTAWKEIFKRPVSPDAAREYLEFKESTGVKPHMKKQSGGAAPLDWVTQPGLSLPNGNFLEYLTSGLSAYNSFNQDSFRAQCGKEDSTPQLPADLGSNKVGGARRKDKRNTRKVMKGGMARLIPADAPPSYLQDASAVLRGQAPATQSGNPTDATYQFTRAFPNFTGTIAGVAST